MFANYAVYVFKDGTSDAGHDEPSEVAQDSGEQSSSPAPETPKVEPPAGYEEKVVSVHFSL